MRGFAFLIAGATVSCERCHDYDYAFTVTEQLCPVPVHYRQAGRGQLGQYFSSSPASLGTVAICRLEVLHYCNVQLAELVSARWRLALQPPIKPQH